MIAWARGQRLEVRLQRLLLTSILFLACSLFSFGSLLFLCGSGFLPLNSDLEPLTLFPGSDRLHLQAGVRRQLGGLVGCFPGEVTIAAAEVSVRGSLAVDRTSQ